MTQYKNVIDSSRIMGHETKVMLWNSSIQIINEE